MKEKNKSSSLIKNLVVIIVGLALAFGISCWRGVFELKEVAKIISAISDGFFVIGMLYFGFGLMLVIVNEGILDIIGFGFKSLVYLFSPRRLDRDSGGYYEYKMAQKEKRAQSPVSTGIIWIGLAFILIAIALLVIYYAMS